MTGRGKDRPQAGEGGQAGRDPQRDHPRAESVPGEGTQEPGSEATDEQHGGGTPLGEDPRE